MREVRCGRCGAYLYAQESRALGYGPDCWWQLQQGEALPERRGWPEPGEPHPPLEQGGMSDQEYAAYCQRWEVAEWARLRLRTHRARST